MRIQKIITIIAIAIIAFQMPAAFAEETEEVILTPPYFTDVQEGSTYYLAVNYLYENKIIHGYEDGTFKPGNQVNRAEALKMILLAFDIEINGEVPKEVAAELTPEAVKEETAVVKFTDLETGKTVEENAKVKETPPAQKELVSSFSDVDEGVWYEDFVTTAVNNGLVNGYPDGTFGPAKNITLGEALKINLEADKAIIPAEVPDEVFTDVAGADWFSGYVLYAKDLLILNVTTKNTIKPHQEMTRGKLAELIYRIHKSKEGYMFGIASYYGDQFHGRTTASGTIFDNTEMTAASRTLPFGTVVRVMNPKFDASKHIDVTITDRGPYAFGRVIDLSKSAFEKIEHPGAGLTKVQYKIMTPEELDKEKQEMIKSAYT